MAEQAGDAIARLDRLRASGAERVEPVRFAYLQALARRLNDQPAAIRTLLAARISAEAAALENRCLAASAVSEAPPSPPSESPLGLLLHDIGEMASSQREAQPLPPAGQPKRAPAARKSKIGAPAAPELKSVTYFRKTWSKLSTEQQLTQTLAQAPENAGPMNSQHLVLRSLEFMRDTAPAYLQGFMSYIDALIWLEEASPLKAATPAAKAKEARAKDRAAKESAGKEKPRAKGR